MIFDFRCQECDIVFEELVKSNSSISEVKCKNCGSNKVVKLLSKANFKFNGSGFYCTDYKNKK